MRNAAGRGSVESDAHGAGLTATWYGQEGTYLDLQAAYSRTSTDFDSHDLGKLASNRKGDAWTLSAEAGHRYPLNAQHTLIPQMQVQTTRLVQDRFTDEQGNWVDLGSDTYTEARLGLAWELKNSRDDRFYLIGNLLHEFSPRTQVVVDNLKLEADQHRTWGELSFGGSVNLASSLMFYGEGSVRRDLGSSDSDAYALTAGLRYAW